MLWFFLPPCLNRVGAVGCWHVTFARGESLPPALERAGQLVEDNGVALEESSSTVVHPTD